MRILLVKNNRIKDVYNFSSIEDLENALGLQGGEYFVSEEGNIGDFWPIPEDSSPVPQSLVKPPTPEAVRSELDGLRENAVAEYVAKWGDLSKREMWQPLKEEIKELALITSAAGVVAGAYPSIVGFLQGSGVAAPTAQQIYDTAAALRVHQSNHLKELRRTEVLRETILNAYVAEPEADRLAWLATQSIEQRWSVVYGA